MWPHWTSPLEPSRSNRDRLVAAVWVEVCDRQRQSLQGAVWRHYRLGLNQPGTTQSTTRYVVAEPSAVDARAPFPWHGTWHNLRSDHCFEDRCSEDGFEDRSPEDRPPEDCSPEDQANHRSAYFCTENQPWGEGEPLSSLQGNLGSVLLERFSQPVTAGQLWIMGPSGMGKTTALVELAAELVQRAKADDQAPIPVLVHALAAGDRSDGLPWLVEALQHKYGIDPNLGYRWLMDGTILPLLDGWDEISPQAQAELAVWIQDWWQQGKPMVVAGDARDRSIPRPRAILSLHPLTDDHLAAYLSALGLTDKWLAIQTQPATLAQVRTPLLLMLALLTRPTEGPAQEGWPSSPGELLDHFIAQQLHAIQQNRDSPPTPSPDRWLTWLAHPHHWGDIFWLEAMQPTLLKEKSQQRRYQLLGGLLFGLAGGMIFSLFVGRGSGMLAFAVISLMFVLVRRDAIIDTEADLCPDFPSFLRFIAVRQINFILVISAVTGIGMLLSSRSWVGLGAGIVIGLVVGLLVRAMILIPSGLLGGIIYGLSRLLDEEVAVRHRPNQGILVRLEYCLGLTALFLWGLILLKVLGLGLLPQVAPALTAKSPNFLHLASLILAMVLWANIFASGLVCAQHAALRLVLYWAEGLPWNLAQALQVGCDAHLLQRVGGHYRFIHPQVRNRLAQGSAPGEYPDSASQNINIPAPTRKS